MEKPAHRSRVQAARAMGNLDWDVSQKVIQNQWRMGSGFLQARRPLSTFWRRAKRRLFRYEEEILSVFGLGSGSSITVINPSEGAGFNLYDNYEENDLGHDDYERIAGQDKDDSGDS
ncbi:hypothetical protein NEOLEDRAFT_1151835 [Neolentinus lepideus HHB14362 ss-1]|uniref:Uncharacterized protein n=1 Tax=Neolentinus lepideus HHB14362 ss-1 TaxID=1314782 RepID=A0A165NJD2_9AGAM|nr:hypothetical protein NEOLEDRAFT_1151835 [Neolentinus lepideus HHB14362 ss-1]